MVSKQKIDKLYIMRDNHYTKGLIDLINYLNKYVFYNYNVVYVIY